MFSMFRAFFLKADEQKPKRLMQKPLLERSYVEKWCRNHGNRYIELPKAITWFDGEVESCCFFFAAISSYALFYRPIAAPKALELVPKGLEHALLTTEFAAKTCHDTGSGKQRLCLRDNLSCFLILPDEFIEQSYSMKTSPAMLEEHQIRPL